MGGVRLLGSRREPTDRADSVSVLSREGRTSDVITIKQAWERYTNEVMPSGASPALLHSDRRAFYAGAAAILKAILELSDDDVSESESVLQMERLVDEAQAFRSEMKPRRK